MAKINDIRFLARETAKEVSGSPRDWMGYLDTASRLYRYPFSDTLLIHAQRPDATACAELEVWNEKMRRWVNRGAKGIALIDDTGPRRALRYVFDVSDTHPVRGGKTPYLWRMKEEQQEMILNHLADTYGLDGDGASDLAAALRQIAEEMAADSLEEAMDGIGYAIPGTFLEGLDDDTIRVEFRTLLANSAFYSLARRCGLEPMEYLEEADFSSITDYNDLSVLAFLGNATSQLVEPILRDIGRTIRQAELEEWRKQAEESHGKPEKTVAKKKEVLYNKFNTLIRESENDEGGKTNGTDLSPQGRLPVSEPDASGGTADHREIRDAAEDIPERIQEEPVPEPADEREAGQPPAGDRAGSAESDGEHDGKAAYEVSGSRQRDRSDGVDSTHEQPDTDGGGNRADGIGIQLSKETTEQDLSEAEEEAASAFSLPELPTVEQQIRTIEERQAALYAGETAIPADVIDEVLRKGGNRDRSHLRIIYNFMMEQTPEEYTDFVRREYGTGGIGLVIGGKEYSVWYNELGMQIAVGHTVHDRILDKTFLSWEDVSGRIQQLLKQGEYAPQSVLDAARDNALKEHAQTLLYMERDLAEGVAELVFADTEPFRGGFPEATEKVSALLDQPEYLADLNERLAGLAEAFEMDKELMRFPWYRPDKVAAQFQKFAKEAIPYQAREEFQWQEHEVFITQDEIDVFLTRGGPYSDGRLSTYAFFIQEKTAKEKADFLKEQYGIGGCSHALSGADDSHADYDGKGIKLCRGDYLKPAATELLKWPQAAKRVQQLIDQGMYLKAGDYSRMPAYEREVLARRVIGFYSRMPEEIERPFKADLLNEDARKRLPGILEEPETAERLVSQMDAALAALPLDFPEYEERAETLSVIHDYIEGTYTIFPEKKKAIEIEGTGQQLSLFDFMGDGIEEPEAPESAAEKEENAETLPETAAENEEETHTPVLETQKMDEPGQEAELEPEKQEPERAEILKPGQPGATLSDEELDEAYAAMEENIQDTMEQAGVSFELFSPEQMDVIYAAAEKGQDIAPVLNPEFSPEQMQLILDVLERLETDNQAVVKRELSHLTTEVMSLDTINTIRQYYHIPLEPEKKEPAPAAERQERAVNFRITDDALGTGSPKDKFRANMDAIRLLHQIEQEGRTSATPEEQEVLSRYVGWGGLQEAFEERNEAWADEFIELYTELDPEEYKAARESTLSAFYTPPVVIKAMYEALGNMGLEKGNVLEPSCGIGNFLGLVPEGMDNLKMYGVELDSISGRIAKLLYPEADITINGFEKTQFPDGFFDVAVGNIPFGGYKLIDRRYDRQKFFVHDYFIAKTIDKVRPGGVIAFVTSNGSSGGTMDKKDASSREYIAQRCDLLGAIRLPNNAFQANAGTRMNTDILFLQKLDAPRILGKEVPEWVQTDEILREEYTNDKGETSYNFITVNRYFQNHPEMVLGEQKIVSGPYGPQLVCQPIAGADLGEQLKEAVSHIHGTITEMELEDSDLGEIDTSIPADPSIKNFSFANVDGVVYYRENSRMNRMELPAMTTERVLGMIELRDLTQELLQCQLEDGSDEKVHALQEKLNQTYDKFTGRYGLISSNANKRAFSQDSSYCLLSSLEILDEEGNLKRKADIFTKRTIRKPEAVTSVDTASEALAVSIGERAKVDVPFMAQLSGKTEEEVTEELAGVIFKNPVTESWETSDEYLSGNVREKLETAGTFAKNHPEYAINVQALERVQPKDLDASEIEVRLGATWIEPAYITQFMGELFGTPDYLLGRQIEVKYAPVNGQWNVSGKNADYRNPRVTATYGTQGANAYRLLEDALNLRDTKIYDTVQEDGTEKRVLNKKETMLAQQKQEMIREEFKEWIFRDMDRRETLCRKYNELFNSIRPREYDGSHIQFAGMTPEITLMPHQKNAVAHILYGHNTLLAHCVGAGKTFQMIAAGMESKRLGLSQKNLYVVPNHLTEQWGSDFLRLYPNANVLVATKKDFEPANRKKFCSRIATGDYDAIIIGHSQFERIPLSRERQAMSIEKQIDEITMAIEEAAEQEGSRYTVKQMEKTRKNLETKLERLNDQSRKDDVVTFEQLGVDRLFVDESHFYKNLFLYTKMRNIAGIAQTDAQKSSDMFAKCQYLDEITGGRGVTFATGTPVSNSMVELYTIMRYLQYDTLQAMGLGHFDSWAAAFGETVTAIELSPEGTGYRAKTRFARFFNLPELISLFKESADIQTADMLHLPVPEAEYINEVLKPSPEQEDLVSTFADRAEMVRSGLVEPREDNMLKITNDGRKCALDQRLINDMLPDFPDSKVNRCVKNAFDIWQETAQKRSTQLIFCDLSTPKNNGTFNVYDDVREKLVAKGIPREEIAFIHEAGTEAKKAELFAKVRSGKVRILLGSTPKLGAGTNIQDRLIALHHLDCPWKPADLEQQEGRILRQGNQNKKVKIFRYVTENTFDAYMWQILENKQKFISQIMTSKSPVRACEDVDDAALSYAEIKALATGNPYIKEKMDLDIQVSKLKLMKANHTSQKYRLETDIAKNYPLQITAAKERLEGLKADFQAVKPLLEKGREKDEFSMTVGGKEYTDRKESGTALIAACAGLKAVKTSGQIGEFYGFQMSAEFDSFNQKYMVTLKRQCSYKVEIGKDALGNLQRISNALSGIEKKAAETQQKLETLQQQLETAKEEVAKPFEREQELAEKSERLAELNSLLNMDEKGPAEVLGTEDGTVAADQPGSMINDAGRVAEEAVVADTPRRPSVLGKLKEAQERIAAGQQKIGKHERKVEPQL
ncbi:helicase-related protein [Merdimonas faecis]